MIIKEKFGTYKRDYSFIFCNEGEEGEGEIGSASEAYIEILDTLDYYHACVTNVQSNKGTLSSSDEHPWHITGLKLPDLRLTENADTSCATFSFTIFQKSDIQTNFPLSLCAQFIKNGPSECAQHIVVGSKESKCPNPCKCKPGNTIPPWLPPTLVVGAVLAGLLYRFRKKK